MSHKCYLCGHIDDNVNRVLNRYVGGEGYVSYPICASREECLQRMAQLENCKHCHAEGMLTDDGEIKTCLLCGRPHDKQGNLLISEKAEVRK